MTPAEQAPWNSWFESMLAKALDENPFAQSQVETLGWTISELRRQWKQHIEAAVAEQASRVDVLEQRLAALEDEPSGYQG